MQKNSNKPVLVPTAYSARTALWTLALVVLLCPLLICYGTTAIISKGMQENVGPFVGVQPVKKEAVTEDDIIAASELRSDDDYIFVNGKMVKNPNKEETK